MPCGSLLPRRSYFWAGVILYRGLWGHPSVIDALVVVEVAVIMTVWEFARAALARRRIRSAQGRPDLLQAECDRLTWQIRHERWSGFLLAVACAGAAAWFLIRGWNGANSHKVEIVLAVLGITG